MSETYQFNLPMIEAAQAQKHVTVNEALARLDAVAQMRVVADDWDAPPMQPADGEAYIVGANPSGEWADSSTKVAIFANGGWVFLDPKIGWRAWNETLGIDVTFDGVSWVRNSMVLSSGGAATLHKVIELDHLILPGSTSYTIDILPTHSQVLGVTARVLSDITGSGVSSWSLGIAGNGLGDRYGSGFGLSQNSYANGPTGPLTYWVDTPLKIKPDAGSLTGGEIRFAVHYVELLPPRSV